ncbi:MAG: amidophosphoribosyltransferase, partial [Acidobacteria bacterium]
MKIERVSEEDWLEDDKFHDHCGVFGITDSQEAAQHAFLGLYGLQHRGQESAGIVSSDGVNLYPHKGMGHVSDVFDDTVLAQLAGTGAI